MPTSAPENKQETAADLLAAASKMPGVAELMNLYGRQAQVVNAAQTYMQLQRPPVTISAGTDTVGTVG